MRRLLFFILLLLSVFSFTFSNELKGKNFLISQKRKAFLDFSVIDENSTVIPVLDNGILVNSRIFVKDSNRRFYLRENGKYAVKLAKDSYVLKWRVDQLEIIESYFLNSDGVDYTVEIKNKSNKGRLVGIYFIYDTYLGEKNGKHFIDSEGEVYTREKSFQGFNIPRSIKSINDNNQGLEFIFPEEKNKKPDRVILGNWEQLSRSKKWPYIPNDGSRFSYGYYSINDSGLGLVYPSTSLITGESVIHGFKIKFYSGITLQKKEIVTEDDSKWNKEEPVVEDVVVDEAVVVEPEVIEDEALESLPIEQPEVIVEQNDTEIKPLNPEKEELLRMLEYVRKKRSGEDVTGYDFDEDYIIEKLKEINE